MTERQGIPNASVTIVGPDGRMDHAWYRSFARMVSRLNDIPPEFADDAAAAAGGVAVGGRYRTGSIVKVRVS